MSTIKELHKENTADKWPDNKHIEYIAVDGDLSIYVYFEEPDFDADKIWRCPWDPVLKKMQIDQPIARLAMRIALEHGPANSLLQRPVVDRKTFWKPGLEQKYYEPNFFPPAYKSDLWDDITIENDRYKRGLVFKEPKHARWVTKDSKDPMILQAALAVDGLASAEQLFASLQSFCYIHMFYDNFYKSWQFCIKENMGNFVPEKIYFKSEGKAREALEVELPDGRTLKQYLKGEQQ